jgi:hypothetical protein
MSKEKLDQLFDNAVRDTLIENLERRQGEIVDDLKLILRHYAAEDDDDEYGEETENDNDVQLNWEYEETEDWNDV